MQVSVEKTAPLNTLNLRFEDACKRLEKVASKLEANQ